MQDLSEKHYQEKIPEKDTEEKRLSALGRQVFLRL